MKNIFLPLLISSFIFGACNQTAEPKIEENAIVQTTAPITATVDPMEAFTAEFKKAVQANDAKMVSDLCDFPFESGLKQSEFIHDFELFFDEMVRKELDQLTTQTWIDNIDGKKQATITLPVEGVESQVIFIAAKKGEKYKLVDILIAG